MFARRFLCVLLILALAGAGPTTATDGMSLEGWGAVSTSLGGTAMAYDNGLAALMNNPSTLILMPRNARWWDLGLSQLGPNVTATVETPYGDYRASSNSDSFYMPSIGWATRRGEVTYALGMFAQGGMGCEYLSDTWLGSPFPPENGYQPLVNRSEVSVGRAIGALAYEVNSRFAVGGTLDFVWAGLDLQMAMNQTQFMDMVNPMSQHGGYANGSLVDTFGAMYEPFGGMGVRDLHYAYFDFTNDSEFTGESRGYGFAAKLGFLWQATNTLTVGGTWHSETVIDDLESSNAVMSMGVSMDTGLMMGGAPSGQYAAIAMPLQGSIRVRDFQWPMTYALGIAWRPDTRTMVSFDIKRLHWSEVMESFDMTFTADPVATNGGLAGLEMNAGLYQHWEDQTVYSAGIAYAAARRLELRAGVNLTDNPIPDTYVNPLFPAIIEQHAMAGVGYEIGEGVLDLVVVRSFPKEVTAPGNGSSLPAVTASHDQWNWAIQYGLRF